MKDRTNRNCGAFYSLSTQIGSIKIDSSDIPLETPLE